MDTDHLPIRKGWSSKSVLRDMAENAIVSEMKHVQELGLHGDEPPLRYIHKDRFSEAFSSATIPVVDLNLILSPSAPAKEKQDERDKLRSALASWGFFQAIGHGIPNSLLDDVRSMSKEFFHLPMDQKREYLTNIDSKEHDALQGYGNDQIISEEQSLDWTDRLYLLVKPQEQRSLKFWPEHPEKFREVVHEYSTKVTLLADNILKAMAKVVGLEEDAFLSQFGKEAPIYARFNYYPPCSKPNLVYGLKPHSDASGITIVLQDEEVEGLHVLKDGEWFKVPIIPHALVVNIADQMEIMSNGMFRSQVHRVVPDSEKERISLAMFYTPYFANEIGPVEDLIDKTQPRMYRNIKVKDYIEIFMEKFLLGERAIHLAKV